jgi:drug/metabolite transporter (DMT)-like permease
MNPETMKPVAMTWLLIGIMVGATTAGEVLQAMGMRRHGEIHDFRPGAIGRALALMARNRFVIGSMVCMAASFFAFMKLLAVADLSFAVPVSAVTYVLETVLAKYLLKEHVNWLRWTGASLVVCGVALVSL